MQMNHYVTSWSRRVGDGCLARRYRQPGHQQESEAKFPSENEQLLAPEEFWPDWRRRIWCLEVVWGTKIRRGWQ